MSTRTDLRTVLGPIADVAMPHLQGPKVTVANGRKALATALDADIEHPLAETMFGFQRAGLRYALNAKRAIIGHDMGCGKTIQAIAALIAARTFPAIVVCPPSLTLNWVREFGKWDPSIVTHRITGRENYELPAAQVYIIGDAVVSNWVEPLIDLDPRAIIVDEIHRMKSRDAKRTNAVKEIARYVDPAGLFLGLSGTIVVNNPMELIAPAQIVGVFEPVFGDVQQYLDRYFPKVGRWERQSRFLDELYERMLDTFYCRVNFEDVRDQLGIETDRPHRLPVVVEMEGQPAREYKAAREDLRAFLVEHRGEMAANKAMRAEALVQLNTLRRLIGKSKVANTVKYVKDLVDNGEQVVVFAVHRDVTTAIAKAFDAPMIIGGMKTEDVEAGKARFQAGDAKVIVLNITAGGTGHTLTAAANVVFAEYGWTPGEMEQAEGRCYRIGQTRQVVSHWLSGGNGSETIDERLVSILNTKGTVTGAIVKGEGEIMIDAGAFEALLDWAENG
jgi:SWI/SNF-related matrix-associated actin-dependent regulator of chromatin subfamily A-like protein 1